ncbi:MAG: hypothetical protein KIT33_08585 [Candidatus Kapabacteria bacterium]|nr:hypothetical protein [Ignavibacteriota bacterium]MCW5885012.1 hypothetical protein [Candidatus Kapabacteria bacterium]
MLHFKQYAAFGETTLDTLGVTRQGIQKLTMDNEKLTMVWVTTFRLRSVQVM